MTRLSMLVRLAIAVFMATVIAGVCTAELENQEGRMMGEPLTREDLFGLKIDEGAERTSCRSLPFLACLPENRGKTT